MSDDDKREEALFDAALQLAAPEERAAFINNACPDDEPLQQRLFALLRGHDQTGALLDKPMAGLPARTLVVNPAIIQPTEKAGDKIGRYKLLQQIGEGGCGVVYMADQEEPVRRRVALKIIKLGMDTKQVIARFEAERQALALMDHPNIAKVLDAGATETGRPYFVMELVRGIRITDYCDQNHLSTRDRLSLFNQVCHAIQHAHQKGIIHRDIKPSNILVTMHDGVPVPKVIDFGIAKATEQRLTDKTLFTAFEQFMGTPAYMSPEQAEMSGLDIDTRSDIYSLGVLLYELLTGKTPFDAHELLSAGLDAMRHTIREREPARPSTCLSTMQHADLATVAKHRQSEAPKLINLLYGDLDWVVMKALEKDRTRRYETANGLAMDLQRHLNNEPVLAAPPSWSYRLSKTMRKHRRTVAVALALAFLLVAGTTVSLWQAGRASREAGVAEVRRREAEASRQTATEAQNRAEGYAKELSHQLAREYVDKGAQLLDTNDYFGSLVWFTEALRLDEGNPDAEALHRVRICAVLQQCPKLRQLFMHRDTVLYLEFSPDGQRLVTAGKDGTARIWDVATGAPLTPPLVHGDDVVGASFSPNGQRVLTASLDNTARIWDANTGAPLTPPMQHGSNVFSAVFSPDGRRVVTASADNTARVWDAATGQPVTPPLQHGDIVWPASFSPDGRFVVTASQDKTARIWDAETGRPVTPPLRHPAEVWWATFSPDGKLVATACEDHTARIWDARTGAPLLPPMELPEAATYVAFNPDGKRLVTACGESLFGIMDSKLRPGEARVWDVATGKPLTPPMPHKLSVYYAVFSPDGRCVATASQDATARVWDANTGEPITPPLVHQDVVFRAAFSPDSRFLATASFDGGSRIWEVVSNKPTLVKLKDTPSVGNYRFSPDGLLVAGTDWSNGAARVWNAITGVSVTPYLHNTVSAVTFSPDSRLLATTSADHTVRLWDANTGVAVAPPLRHDGNISSIAFSPDSRRIITTSEDKTARIWDANSGTPLTPPLKHASNVLCAVFSPDGRRVITGSEDHNARVWDTATGTELTAALAAGSAVKHVVFSPDNSRVLTATRDGMTQVWDPRTGKPITSAMKQWPDFFGLGIESIAFGPNGHRFLVADSNGRTVRIWNADTGAPVTPPFCPTFSQGDGIIRAIFSQNGRYVLTISPGNSARVWDSATGQPVTPPLQGAGLTDAIFTPDDQAVKTVCVGEKQDIIETWNLGPDNRPANELVTLAQLLSFHHLDASGAVMPMDFESLTNISSALHQ